ncbi:transporter [Agromyces aureus]|uniref:Transporter n=1 Tax=Agromyces aureus TaxID=453304 RepID=A0A191WIR1_9MICO|nr:transporter [Agromyces aureus]ANJ28205.1 transporter [Agromyces aureus]
MVATLVRLRFLLLWNSLQRSPWQMVAVVIGGLYGLGILIGVIAGLVALGFASIDVARTIVVLAGAALVLGWTFLPVLTSGIDQTVEPSRLVPFPIPISKLLVGLAVSGVLGVPGIVTSLAALATALTWVRYPLAAVAAVVCAVIGVLTCVIGSRMLVALVSVIGEGRRFREAKGLVVFIPIILLGPIILGLQRLLSEDFDSLPQIASVVAWTPFGAIWAVPADVAAGQFGRAGLEFLIGVVTLVVFALVWRWSLAKALETPARSTPAKAARRGLGFFGTFPGTPAGAVAARALTYWIRDPRYAQSLITLPLVPVFVLVYAGSNGDLTPLNSVGPIIAFLLALSIYADISYDNTAFALHLQQGVSGRDDRIGRVLALAVFAVPLSLLTVLATVWLTGAWTALPGLLGITVGVLLSGFGLSSLVSGRFIFAVPAPGESPFKSKPGGGFSLTLSLFATWGILTVLVLPELVLAIVGFATGQVVYGWISLALGIVLGSVLLVIGIRVGGDIYDRRGPELLAALQRLK